MRSTLHRALEVMVWILDLIPRMTEAENRVEKISHLYCRKINLDKEQIGRKGIQDESRRAVRTLLKDYRQK